MESSIYDTQPIPLVNVEKIENDTVVFIGYTKEEIRQIVQEELQKTFKFGD